MVTSLDFSSKTLAFSPLTDSDSLDYKTSDESDDEDIFAYSYQENATTTINGDPIHLTFDFGFFIPAIRWKKQVLSGDLALKKIIELARLQTLPAATTDTNLLNTVAKIVNYLCSTDGTLRSCEPNSASLKKKSEESKQQTKQLPDYVLSFTACEITNSSVIKYDVSFNLNEGLKGIYYKLKTVP